MQTLIGIIIFVICVALVEGLLHLIALPFSSGVVVMALLFVYFLTGRHVPAALEAAATFLLKMMPLLFIPPIVSSVRYLDGVVSYGAVFLFAVTLSSCLGLISTGLVYKWLTAFRAGRKETLGRGNGKC